jgi:hypothetical protein
MRLPDDLDRRSIPSEDTARDSVCCRMPTSLLALLGPPLKALQRLSRLDPEASGRSGSITNHSASVVSLSYRKPSRL